MRKSEIQKRLAEIRGLLSGTDEVDVTALELEVRTLTAELETIEKRSVIAASINVGTIEAKSITKPTEEKSDEDPYGTVEYRKQFMEYCKTGKSGIEKRVDAFTTITDAAAVIPTTIMNELVRKMLVYGQVYNRTRKLAVKGGVNFPILSLKPVATWITESSPSERQKLTANTSVSFSYFGLECKIATSLLAETVTLPMFEASFITLAAEAMVKAMEIAVVKGAGGTQPLGFTVDPRVPAGQIVTLTPADFADWGAWKKKVFAKIPLAYRAGGSFVMSAQTFEGYIDGMQDLNGQPMARVNYGIADAIPEKFGGREVILVEDDIIAPYESAAVGDVVAAFIKLSDYVINSNMQMVIYRYLDQDLNQWIDKAILIADGKLIDPNGVVLIKKGA